MSKGHSNHHASIIPHNINQTRSLSYQSVRILGDINAINKDGSAILKRLARRVAGRSVSRVLWGKLLK